MAEKKKVEAPVEETAAPKKKRATKKKEAKVEEKKVVFGKPTTHDFDHGESR